LDAMPFDPRLLVKIANVRMPFGKYAGTRLLYLPEEYLLWFRDKGFPKSYAIHSNVDASSSNGSESVEEIESIESSRTDLGQLLALTLEIKIQGLEKILEPLITEKN